MNKKLIIAIVLLSFNLLLFLNISSIKSQTLCPEVFSCFGGYIQNSSVQLSWTAGEPLYTIVQNTNNILTQGFNQTNYVISNTTGIEELPGYQISIYPNPTKDVINVSLKMEKQKTLNLQLIDMQGKCLFIVKSANDLEQIDFSQFAYGIYFLKISDNQQIINTYKIQKVQ